MEKYGWELVDSVMGRAEAVYRDFLTRYCNYGEGVQVRVEKKVGRGEAKDVICRAVGKLGADILVMGSHDYGFFKRYKNQQLISVNSSTQLVS